MSQPMDVVQSVEEFDNRVAETQSGSSEVQDFALRMSHAFPAADMLLPAPLIVSILGQLAIVATATNFKLIEPRTGFKHIQYPDNFRATTTQLVDSGALALRQSFVNFDEINKRCALVRPNVNSIVQLLAGHEDNTPEQNDKAIERHLPYQIESLSKTVEACLVKAKETDQTFADLLALVMEIHQSCHAIQGENESKIEEANFRQKYLMSELETTQEMKRIGETALEEAHQWFTNAQETFNTVVIENTKPIKDWELVALGALDAIENVSNILTLGLFKAGKHVFSSTPKTQTSKLESDSPTDLSEFNDRGYHRASALRKAAECLAVLLVAGPDGCLDWNTIRSNCGGCTDIKNRFQEEIKILQVNNRQASQATNTANALAEKGQNLAINLESITPPTGEDVIEKLRKEVSAWREEVVAFACEADLKLGGGNVETRLRNAQYSLAVTQSQLNMSRENSRVLSHKLIETNRQLDTFMAEIATIDMQKRNWEEIAPIVEKSAHLLSQLKGYLHNLVHFFDKVHNFVSVTMKEATDKFIANVKNSAAIENNPGGPGVKQIEGVILDAWTREAIYQHALSAAKISKVVENISGMYVTLYDGHVHPGVNMLFGMSKVVGPNDCEEAVAAAGKEIRDWAQGASYSITQLIRERTQANERDIQNRMRDLEKSLGTILPQSSSIEEIVHNVEKMQVQETTRATEAAADANSVYTSAAKGNSQPRKKISKKVYV